MNVHFVIHESFEAPGAFESWTGSRGHKTSYSRVYENAPLPTNLNAIDLLVVMGGPQSPATTKAECPHFDSKAEQTLMNECIAAGKAVIGVCLGAQLLGEALGAAHCRSPEKEIGKFPITLTKAGETHPLFAHFGDTLDVGHWHSDMPGLTGDAKVLAYSEGCPRQIVEYGNRVFGFQCHMELTAEVVDLLIASSTDELATLETHRFVQQPDALRANDYEAMNQALFQFLDKLLPATV
jgi:GMP synthase (glutamine-hydrolysing)